MLEKNGAVVYVLSAYGNTASCFVTQVYGYPLWGSECCMFIPGTYAEMMQDYG